MAFSDRWHTMLEYFGLREVEDGYHDEPEPESEIEDRYRERPNVRRLQSRRRRDDFDDIFADDPPRSARETRVLRPVGNGRAESVQVHLVIPKSFNDAQHMGRRGRPRTG